MKKNVLKWGKNVYVRVIGPVEFRKTGYFATWWRLVAREHDFKPKMKVFLLLVNFKKLKNTRHGLVRVKKCHLIIEKPLKFYQKKNIGHDGKRRVSGSRFTGHMIISDRLGSNLKTSQNQTNDTSK